MKDKKMKINFLCIFLSILFLPISAQAHKLKLFVWSSDNMVIVESEFAANRPLINGKVMISDKKNHDLVLSGNTSQQGLFVFTVPEDIKNKKIDLKITVSAGDGHQNEWLLKASEYLTENIASANNTGMQKDPGLKEALAGIGYLLGIAGIIAWRRSIVANKN